MKKFIVLLIIGILVIILGYYLKENVDNNIDYKINEIRVIDHYFPFDKDIKTYDIMIKSDEKKLEFEIDTNYDYEIVGNEDLKENDVVYLNLYVKNRRIHTYEFNIKKDYKLDFYGYNIENVTLSNDKDAIKSIKVKDKTIDLKFSHDLLNEDFCPNNYMISIGGVVFFSEKMPCTSFYDFNVIDDIIVFAYENKDGVSIISIKDDGYILFKLSSIYDSVISKYSDKDAIKIENNNIRITSSKVINNSVMVDGEFIEVCKLDNDDEVAYEYTFNFLGDRFSGANLSSTIRKKDVLDKYNCK